MFNDVIDQQLFVRLIEFVGWVPYFVVAFIGGVVCLVRLRKDPRKSFLIGLAIVFMLFADHGITMILNRCMTLWPDLFVPNPTSESLQFLMIFLYVLPQTIFQTLAWGLIFYAAFGPGSEPQSRSRYLIED